MKRWLAGDHRVQYRRNTEGHVPPRDHDVLDVESTNMVTVNIEQRMAPLNDPTIAGFLERKELEGKE